jgi:WD40 repeat protein
MIQSNYNYKAFLSYSHSADGKLAPALQSALHGFAKPLYRLRAMRVFRDKTSLAMTPELWPSIEKALTDSEYFLLLASPQAAASQWVQEEVDWWLGHRPANTLFILLTEGELFWDRTKGDFDWTRTTALPKNLQGCYTNEPLYVDLRWARSEEKLSLRHANFRAAILDIAAPLQGKPKDELDGEDIRQNRKTRRLAWMVAFVILSVAVTAVWQAVIARQERREAEQQRQTAQANEKQAIANAEEAERQKGIAKANEKEARRQELLAKENETSALRQQALAEKHRKEAERQHTVAVARQLTAQSELTKNRSDNDLAESALLAVEAMKRHPSMEGDQVLRHELSLLPQRVRLINGKSWISSVAFSPKGKYMAAGDYGGVVRVWEIETYREVIRIENHSPISAMGFQPETNCLLTVSHDEYLRVWDITTGEKIREKKIALGNKGHAYFSLDSKYLVSAKDSAAYVMEIASGVELMKVSRDREVTALAFSQDGRYLATASGGVAHVSDRTTGKDIARLDRSAYLSKLALSPEGKLLATVSDAAIRVSEIATGRELAEIRSETALGSLHFSPDAKLIAAASGNRMVQVWDARTGRELVRIPFKKEVWDLDFSLDGHSIVTGGMDGAVQVWKINNSKTFRIPFVFDRPFVETISLSPNGIYLAAICETDVFLWNTVTGRELGHLGLNNWFYELVFSPDSTWLAAANSGDTLVRVWEAGSARQVATLKHEKAVNDLAFSPDSQLLASASDDGQVRVWDVFADAERPLKAYEGGETSVAFDPNGRYIALASKHSMSIRNRETDHVKFKIREGGLDMNFSQNRALLVARGIDNTTRVWNTSDGREVKHLKVEGDLWKSIISQDGEYVATISTDPSVRRRGRSDPERWTIRVVAVEDGRIVSSIEHESPYGTSFSPDGKYFLTVEFHSQDSSEGIEASEYLIRARLLWPNDLINEACDRLTRNLSHEEWKRYLPDEAYRKTCPNLP